MLFLLHPKTIQGNYVSPVDTPINIQIIPYDPYGNHVSGIAGELELIEGSPTGLIQFSGKFTEQGITGIYDSTYTGINAGSGVIIAKHINTEQSFNVEILPKIRRIDITPNTLKNSTNLYQLIRDKDTRIKIVPYNQYGEIITSIPTSEWKIDTNDARTLSCTQNITATATPGVYETICTGLKFGVDEIKVSYDDMTTTIPVIIGTNVKGVNVLTQAATDNTNVHRSIINEQINLELTPYDEQGNAISGIENELTFTYSGDKGLLHVTSITENGSSGTYLANYTGLISGNGMLTVNYNLKPINSIDIQVVDVVTIELKPGATLNGSTSRYDSRYKDEIELQVIPLAADGRMITQLPANSFTFTNDRGLSAIDFGPFGETSVPGIYSLTYEGVALGDDTIYVDYNGIASSQFNIEVVPPRIYNTISIIPSTIGRDSVTSSYDARVNRQIDLNLLILDKDRLPIDNLESYLDLAYSKGGSTTFGPITKIAPGTYSTYYQINYKTSGELYVTANGENIGGIDVKAFEVKSFGPSSACCSDYCGCCNTLNWSNSTATNVDNSHFSIAGRSSADREERHGNDQDSAVCHGWMWVHSCMSFFKDCSPQRVTVKKVNGQTATCETSGSRTCTYETETNTFDKFKTHFILNPPSCRTYDGFRFRIYGYEQSGSNGIVQAHFHINGGDYLVGKGYCNNRDYTSAEVWTFTIFYRCYE